MRTTDWPSSLTNTELDELDTFLRTAAKEGDLLLDGVHGLLTALIVGPEPAPPDEWLPEVLHAPFADPQQGERVLALLAKLNDSIGAELDVDAYEPILGELDDIEGPTLSAAGWCEGFSRGIDLRAGFWEHRLAEDVELIELLGPIMALAVDEGVLASDAEFEKLSDEEYEACLQRLPEVLLSVARYWHEKAPSEDERRAAHERQPEEARTENKPPRQRDGHSLH
ncbi:YecA family protein [Oleiagrimonas citrea]|uniref:YecA family protein n=1 Tax=Oleiagrimonas citrea TaxID=1665687 RepID=A0A846ZRB0_9GAMM|nr:YecA family protein [Oleiagrimonas citrea]NKZ40039.1 YecA family protein [Oleiagrimonas citrea]